MRTLSKNSKAYREALEKANETTVWAYTLSNGFEAQPLPEHCYTPGNHGAKKGEYLGDILRAFSFAKLRSDGDWNYLRVHNNEWYKWQN